MAIGGASAAANSNLSAEQLQSYIMQQRAQMYNTGQQQQLQVRNPTSGNLQVLLQSKQMGMVQQPQGTAQSTASSSSSSVLAPAPVATSTPLKSSAPQSEM